MSTAICYTPRFLDHHAGAGHPESPQRLQNALRALQAQPWFGELRQVAPRPAEEEWLRTVHSGDYLEHVRRGCAAGLPFLDTPDVGICPDSQAVALLAAGAGLQLADALMDGSIDNGFALLRPPGHHAEKAAALGFCLFNNIALLARYLQRRHGLEKVLILDWDVHHGNGTQHAFEEDPSVCYISLHQYPFYPGTGALQETGLGRGHGATVNCPMPAASGDSDYEAAFQERVLPAMEAFRPDIVLISAGFDAHRDDPLAQVQLSTSCYAWMTRRVLEIAERHAEGRVLSLLEGGYHLRAMPDCVVTHLEGLLGRVRATGDPPCED